MNARDIIEQISFERGSDFDAGGELDLPTFKDLTVHKTEVWELTLTAHPADYFNVMNERYPGRPNYKRKYQVNGIPEGLSLCKELSRNFGIASPELPMLALPEEDNELYLAIHIHSEFSFTQKTTIPQPSTLQRKCVFVNPGKYLSY